MPAGQSTYNPLVRCRPGTTGGFAKADPSASLSLRFRIWACLPLGHVRNNRNLLILVSWVRAPEGPPLPESPRICTPRRRQPSTNLSRRWTENPVILRCPGGASKGALDCHDSLTAPNLLFTALAHQRSTMAVAMLNEWRCRDEAKGCHPLSREYGVVKKARLTADGPSIAVLRMLRWDTRRAQWG
jgi:hypothetical protein